MPRRKGSHADVLHALSADEGLAVLRALLEAHPELTDEAQGLATRRLVNVDRQQVARAVVACIDALALEDLDRRAGRHAYGYVEPVEGAYEVLEDALSPFTREIQRLLHLGLEEAARAQCEGVLLGLHEIDIEHSSHELVQYAPDFPGEAAESALWAWSAAPGGPRQIDSHLLHDSLIEWVDMVEDIQHRSARTHPAGR